MHLAGGSVLVVQLVLGQGIPGLASLGAVKHEDRPDVLREQILRAVHEPAQVVDELARLVDQHEPARCLLAIRYRDLEKLVQPRGAVDGDRLARQLALVNLGGLDNLVEF